MTALSLIAGIALVGLVLVDLIWTVVAVGEGGGPASSRVSSWLWRLALWGNERVNRNGLLLRFGGVIVVMATLAGWILTMWVGWWLVFVDGSLVETSSGAATDAWGRLYFVGYTIFTLGNGDVVPATTGWRIVTTATNFLGLVLVTLAVTYLVPVTRAATGKRSLANTITALGGTPQSIVTRMWDGETFEPFGEHASDLAVNVSELAQQHLAYPVLHYFHSVSEREALPPRIAALDDALTIMAEGVAPHARPAAGMIEPVREAVRLFLATLESAYITPEVDPPPLIDPEPLRQAGIPVVDAETLAQVFRQHTARRRLAAAFVHYDGWAWAHAVVGTGEVREEFATAA